MAALTDEELNALEADMFGDDEFSLGAGYRDDTRRLFAEIRRHRPAIAALVAARRAELALDEMCDATVEERRPVVAEFLAAMTVLDAEGDKIIAEEGTGSDA